jgi:hypothetical protein
MSRCNYVRKNGRPSGLPNIKDPGWGSAPPQYGGAPLARTKVGALHILDGAGETLVLLGIVVLQSDLEVNSLQKLPLLVLK